MGKLFNLFEEAYLYEAAVATGAVPAQAAQQQNAPMSTNQKLAYGAAGVAGLGLGALAVDDYLEHQHAAEAAEAAKEAKFDKWLTQNSDYNKLNPTDSFMNATRHPFSPNVNPDKVTSNLTNANAFHYGDPESIKIRTDLSNEINGGLPKKLTKPEELQTVFNQDTQKSTNVFDTKPVSVFKPHNETIPVMRHK